MTRAARAAPAVWLVAALSLGVTIVSARYHTWTAAGADASGYVSQAEHWLHRTLTIPQPLALDAPWPEPEWTFAPLGYRPALERGAIVPTYPAGLPMMLAVAQLIGGRSAVYLVVPILAGLGVWATFVLGRRVAGTGVGVVAAVLLAASPIWLRQSTQVMSDVPAATWWTVAMALAYRSARSPRAAYAAGLAAAAAIAIRPNLAPVALAIAGALLADAVAARHAPGRSQKIVPWDVRWAARRAGPSAERWLPIAAPLARFAIGVLPGCLLVAWVHTHLYGSPLTSGYGRNADLYALSNIAPNLRLYSAWLVEGQTPMLLLALGAGLIPLRRSPRRVEDGPTAPDGPRPASAAASDVASPIWPLWLLIGLVAVMYLPYAVFEAWWYIRFLLPAFPATFVLIAVTLAAVASHLPRPTRTAALTTAAAALVAVSIARGRTLQTFDLARDEQRYRQVADALSSSTPRGSAFVCMQHSGSVRFYLDRPTLRWELLPADRLDAALAYLQAKGLHPYILLESWEAPRFRARFGDVSAFGRLDWPPILELRSPTPVRLYDPADRARYFAGGHVATKLVFQPRR